MDDDGSEAFFYIRGESDSSFTVLFEDVVFDDNDGGALNFRDNVFVTIKNSVFNNIRHVATYRYGAAINYDNSNYTDGSLTILNSTFTNNTSVYSGGAVLADNIDVILDNRKTKNLEIKNNKKDNLDLSSDVSSSKI